MKKLLLLTKVAFICFFCFSCQNLQQKKIANVIETKQIIKDSSITTDNKKAQNETPASGTVGTEQVTKKNWIEKTDKVRAITHDAPEQEKIDSIKNAKLKNKK